LIGLSGDFRSNCREGYSNASFEVGGEESLDIVEEFYADEVNQEQHQQS